MANNYYSRVTDFTPFTLADADIVDQELDAVLAAFDLLPVVNTAIVKGTVTFVTESGSANAYAVVFSPVRTAYADGDHVAFFATNTNTGASTLKFDSLSTVSIVNSSGVALAAGSITDGLLYEARYDSANSRFVMINISDTTAAASSATAAASSATAAASSATNAATSATSAALSAQSQKSLQYFWSHN